MSNCKLSIQINLNNLVKNSTFLIKCSQKYVEKTTHVTNEGLLYFGMILCVNKCIDRILLHVFYRKKMCHRLLVLLQCIFSLNEIV